MWVCTFDLKCIQTILTVYPKWDFSHNLVFSSSTFYFLRLFRHPCPGYRWKITLSGLVFAWIKFRDTYFNVRNFRVQKISRISRMTHQCAKLNGREKNILGNSREKIPAKHGFQIFLLIQNIKIGFLAYFTHVFVWENRISWKLIPSKWISLGDSRLLNSIKTREILRMAWLAKFSGREIF